jgi:formylglycine-generating enzyme required for sulfatase activity
MRAGALLVGFFLSALSSTASGQILYGADQFGAVDLVPRQASSVAGLIESLGAKVDRFEPIADFPPDDPIRVLGRAVGRLDILMTAPDGVRGVANCTATLIDRNKILTNHHCVPGPHGAVIERVLVRFGYLELGSTTSRSFEVDLNPIEANRALDYAVLRVEGDPAGAFGIAPLNVRSAQTNEPLFIIHHPAGQPQRLTRAFCRANPKVALEGSALRHQCDTLPGSSGSLIFAQRNNALVGLHNLGGLVAGDTQSFNRGIDAVALKGGSAQFAALCCASPRCDGVEALVGSERRCLRPKDTFRDCPWCPEMVVVPAGGFMMGSPADEPERESELGRPGARKGTEGPQHRVTVPKPFAVGKSAVTRREYEMFVVGSGHDIGSSCWTLENDQGAERILRSFRNPGIPQGDDHPAVCVNWHDAKAFVEYLSRLAGKSYRLLSESEREYVTRAGSRTPFWWGSSISTRQANYNGRHAYAGGARGEYLRTTVEVRRFDPNPWGLFDVHGNVWEWTEDCWNSSYDGAPADGSAWISSGCGERVLRGGSWINHPGFLRAAARIPYAPTVRYSGAGFRIARTLD